MMASALCALVEIRGVFDSECLPEPERTNDIFIPGPHSLCFNL